MRVALINPPSPYLANDAAYPPSGLLYVAAAIERIGHEVSVVDLTGGADWKEAVPRLEADLFGITCVTPNVPVAREISRLLPSGKPVIVGGVHPTYLPEDTRRNIRCDAVVRGESEAVLADLFADLARGELKPEYNGGLTPVEAIPKPARHLVDLRRYRPGGDAATPIYTSRGCPFSCNFCSKITGRSYRVFPIARVMEEIGEVVSLGFRNILFGDDDIAIRPERLKSLLAAIRPLGIRFRLNQDAREIDEEIFRLAREAGCEDISFGIESGSQRMLDAMNKRTTVAANRDAILRARRCGLRTKAYFIVNFPGEDERSIEETLRFAREAKPDKWLLSSFAPLPGSDTYNDPGKYGITWTSPDWEDYYLVGKDGQFRPCFTTRDLTFERQIRLHELLLNGLKEQLG